MSEVQEFQQNNENTPLDPQVEKAGVEYINHEQHLDKINKIIQQEHPDHPGHIPGDIAPFPNTEPSPLSIQQVNGEPISTPIPDDNTSKQPGFIDLTLGALGTTFKSGLESLLKPDAMKDGHKKGVGNIPVSDLPRKHPSDKITEFRPATENDPISISRPREEVKDAA